MRLLEKIEKDIYNSILRSSISLEQDYIDFIKDKIERTDNSKESFFLRKILQNNSICSKRSWPLCQDTGFLSFYITLPDWFDKGFELKRTISSVIENLWKDKGFRYSIVDSSGKNTGNNLPAGFFFDFGNSSELKIDYIIKGGGSENVSLLLTLLPDMSQDEFADVVSRKIFEKAGSKACPPYFIGIGRGGSVEKSTLNSRKALIYTKFGLNSELEKKIMNKLNSGNAGIFGTGFGDTVFSVKIIDDFSHIANNIVSVAVNCHCLRRGSLKYESI